jgi:hypothetical protein
MQTSHQTHKTQSAVAQPVGLPRYDPPPLLLVAAAQQQIELSMPRFVRVFVGLRTMRTLTLMDLGILHDPLSHPWIGEQIIHDFVENWNSYFGGVLGP